MYARSLMLVLMLICRCLCRTLQWIYLFCLLFYLVLMLMSLVKTRLYSVCQKEGYPLKSRASAACSNLNALTPYNGPGMYSETFYACIHAWSRISE